MITIDPHTHMNPALLDRVLRHINIIRADHNAEPLTAIKPGTPRNACCCPITESLRDLLPDMHCQTGGYNTRFYTNHMCQDARHTIPLTAPMQAFIAAFDRIGAVI